MDPNVENPNDNNNGANDNSREVKDRRWFWLAVFQYFLISVVTIIFVVAIVFKADLAKLSDMDTARGLITFVITLGTVAIAVMLTLTAVLIRDFDKRIVVGKEILTILVALLGTIVGFYYGASTTKKDAGQTGADTPVQVSVPPKIAQINGIPTLTAKLSGGTPPYHYSIKFMPDTILPIENQESADGQITHQFKVPVPSIADVGISVEGKDNNETEFVYNKDGKTRTPIP